MLDPQQSDRGLKVLQRFKALIDACKSQVSNLVELPQLRQNRQADLICVDLRSSGRPNGFFNPRRKSRQIGIGHRPALTSLSYAGNDLFAAEWLHHSASLYNVEARGFGSAEPLAALRALPPAANREPVITGSGVDNPRVGETAKRTVHSGSRLRHEGRIFGSFCPFSELNSAEAARTEQGLELAIKIRVYVHLEGNFEHSRVLLANQPQLNITLAGMSDEHIA